MIVGGGQPPEDHRRIGVVFFHDLGQGQTPLDMGHPVQVDSEDEGMQLTDRLLHIKAFTPQHLYGDIYDADIIAKICRGIPKCW